MHRGADLLVDAATAASRRRTTGPPLRMYLGALASSGADARASARRRRRARGGTPWARATTARRGATRAQDRAPVARGGVDAVDRRLLRARVRGAFWDVARRARRHAARHARVRAPRRWRCTRRRAGRPRSATCRCRIRRASPSTAARGVVHVASTRNPNQVYELRAGRPALAATSTPAGAARRAAARAGAVALLPGRALPARPRARRRRAARQRRRAERRRAPRRRRRARPRLVAAVRSSATRRPRARAELPPAQLDRRRPDAATSPSSRPRRDALGRAPPGPPRLPGRPPRRDLLGRDARAGRARPHAAALGAAPRGDALWVDNSGYGERRLVRDGALEAVARPAGLDARPRASPATSRSSARRA